jgi:hypothetical protein
MKPEGLLFCSQESATGYELLWRSKVFKRVNKYSNSMGLEMRLRFKQRKIIIHVYFCCMKINYSFNLHWNLIKITEM